MATPKATPLEQAITNLVRALPVEERAKYTTAASLRHGTHHGYTSVNHRAAQRRVEFWETRVFALENPNSRAEASWDRAAKKATNLGLTDADREVARTEANLGRIKRERPDLRAQWVTAVCMGDTGRFLLWLLKTDPRGIGKLWQAGERGYGLAEAVAVAVHLVTAPTDAERARILARVEALFIPRSPKAA